MASRLFCHNDYDTSLDTLLSGGSPQKTFHWPTFDGFSFPNDVTEIDDSHLDLDSMLMFTEKEDFRSRVDQPSILQSTETISSPSLCHSGGEPLSVNGNVSSMRKENPYQGFSGQLEVYHGSTSSNLTYQGYSFHGSGRFSDLSENFGNYFTSLSADSHLTVHNPAYYTGYSCATASVDQCDMKYDGHQLGGNSTSTSLPITFPKESVAEIIGSQHPSSYDNYLTSQSSHIVPQYRQDVKNSYSPETELELENNDASLTMTHPTENAGTASLFLMTPGHDMMTSGDQRSQHQGEHICTRRLLPEGEEKHKHKRNLANRRNKKYIEKKKMEEQNLEAERIFELERKKMLLKKLHSLRAEKTFYEMFLES